MANTILTPRIIATQAALLLQNNLVYRDLVNNDYSGEFAKVGDTVNVRKRNLLKSKNFDSEIELQDIEETAIPVKLDRLRDISIPITSKEMTLDIKDFSSQVLEPAMLGLAQDVDADIAAAVAGAASQTISATANPTDLADIAGLAKQLDKNKAPKTERRLVFATDHKYKYALTDNLSKVSYAGDNVTLREALLGRVYGFDTYMSQNNVESNATSAGNATSFKVTGTKGATTVALSSVNAASATIKNGDGFIVDGHLYRFTADATASSGAVASVTIDEPLHKAIANTEAVTVVNKPVSVAFHKDAVAFVTRPLEIPQGAVKAYTATAGNIAVRVVMGYDQKKKQDVISIDVLYGVAKLNDKLVVALA